MALFGSEPFAGRKWVSGVRLSGTDAVAEEWVVDPNLLPLGADPRFPTSDYIVIPRGRLVGVRPDNYTYEGRAILTIADGVDPYNKPTGYTTGGVRPAGFTEANIFRQWQEHIQWTPTLDRHSYIEVPYVPSINNAYGTLQGGDRLTAYFGSTTTTTPAQNDKGKLAKWVPNTLYSVHTAAATSFTLPSANYPAFVPRVVMAWNAGTVYTGAAPTFTWSASVWTATFASNVTDVLYTFGQSFDQVIGEVVRIEPLSATHQFEGWLQWVTDNFSVWEYPPMLIRVPTTSVTNENPGFVGTGWFRLANYPIAPHLSISVVLAPTGGNSFTVTDELGNVTTVSSGTTYTLPTISIPFTDYTLGKYYNINPVTGDLFLSTNVVYSGSYPAITSPLTTFNQIQVSYSYETSYRDGRLYNQGIIGLTDGYGGSNYPGTPANLDILGSAGAIRAILY